MTVSEQRAPSRRAQIRASLMCASIISLAALMPAGAEAQTPAAERRADLLRQRDAIDSELRALDNAARPPEDSAVAAPAEGADEILVTGSALSLTTMVAGQTVTTIDNRRFRNTPATTIADIVKLSPGVTVMQGNGPRDVGVSIRGSNARNSFGARNIQVFEDDFPVTQPDGLARFDLTDPHAYGAVDIVRGPSSARYGNYALGGAVNFRTRAGRDIHGAEFGLDGGSNAYANFYGTIGDQAGDVEYSLFGSFVRANGSTAHNGYETGTINALAKWAISPRDRVAFKLIYNEGEFALSTRLSLNQYRVNPYQDGCEAAATIAPGCGVISVLVNGVNGARIAQTAVEGDLARNDRRTIAGARYEHDFDAMTTWRTQATFDSRVVNQPTSATPFKGTLDSYNVTSDVTHDGRIAGMDAILFGGVFYSYLDNQSFSFNKTPGGRNGFGALVTSTLGDIRNLGARARIELELTEGVDLIGGVGAERSIINTRQTAYTYPVAASATQALIPALRHFWNVAPEASLRWQATSAVRLHARVGTGYGVPQSGQLFVTAAGVPGNNIGLKTQKNVGVDAGIELTLGRTLTAEVTGYYEWFRNELLSQSAGVNLLAFTGNVPRSVHRGVELGLAWRPVRGTSLEVNYSYNDQYYTSYAERLTSGTASAVFDRGGNKIPGVMPTFANVRAGYDQQVGALEGLGGFAELTYRDDYWVDNGNLLKIPAYTLVNLNLHYDPPEGSGWLSRLSFFASVQNLLDKTYVGSASVISDSLNAATVTQNPAATLMNVTGSIYAGTPRTVYAGVKARF